MTKPRKPRAKMIGRYLFEVDDDGWASVYDVENAKDAEQAADWLLRYAAWRRAEESK
jgi:hypothetical protein